MYLKVRSAKISNTYGDTVKDCQLIIIGWGQLAKNEISA